MNKFLEAIAEINPEAVRLDGLDEAVVGVACIPCLGHVLAYSKEKCIEVTMRGQDWDRSEALEWLDFNTFSAHFGQFTPVFMEQIEDV